VKVLGGERGWTQSFISLDTNSSTRKKEIDEGGSACVSSQGAGDTSQEKEKERRQTIPMLWGKRRVRILLLYMGGIEREAIRTQRGRPAGGEKKPTSGGGASKIIVFILVK